MIELGLDMIKSFSPKKGFAMRYFKQIVRRQKIKRLFMSEEEIWEQMVQELRERRANHKKGVKITSVAPTDSYNVVNMDFGSLYPSTMTIKFPTKQSIRKKKIKKIFE